MVFGPTRVFSRRRSVEEEKFSLKRSGDKLISELFRKGHRLDVVDRLLVWRRGWDSNPDRLLIIRNLLILQKGRNAENGQNATSRYTAGTRRQRVRPGFANAGGVGPTAASSKPPSRRSKSWTPGGDLNRYDYSIPNNRTALTSPRHRVVVAIGRQNVNSPETIDHLAGTYNVLALPLTGPFDLSNFGGWTCGCLVRRRVRARRWTIPPASPERF